MEVMKQKKLFNEKLKVLNWIALGLNFKLFKICLDHMKIK